MSVKERISEFIGGLLPEEERVLMRVPEDLILSVKGKSSFSEVGKAARIVDEELEEMGQAPLSYDEIEDLVQHDVLHMKTN